MPLKHWLCFFIAFSGGLAHASDLATKLARADHVLLMRHALAPGVGDPAGYVLTDCTTQRNLNAEGLAQAQRTGQWLRAQGVKSAQVFSSPWCRCLDTAKNLDYGPVEIEPSLASFFENAQLAHSTNTQLQKFISQQIITKGQKALVLVTHHVNILAFMGENVNSGDMVLAQVDAKGKMLRYTLYPSPK